MSQGRGSACRILLIGALICVVLHAELVQAATFTVGDARGWTFNVNNWPKGKRFQAGDVLVFKYDSTIHNVVVVDRDGYNNCRTPRGAKVYRSGKDQIRLGKGQNFFLCNIAGHCESGMKIAINAV
ncbi:copper binding protein 6 [Tripterygium wilfordii]|uniref:Basic blue protein n=1 Tax=Tripterygium wilfordii TaxID=458696 RepID=A0A7J7DS13_TRIWF|nr:basic blue protein-like [Tripterygium wilfordii]KAF5749091.1 copper binding protein 6 [Tripterygium wilfordii]